jgi:hypothetical protein
MSLNRAWKSPKSVLSIDAKLECANSGNWNEALFVGINHYSSKQKIKMLFDVHALRALVYALQDLHQHGTSSFKKYTEANGHRNVMTLGSDNNTFFINIERSGNIDNFKIAHLFGIYSLPSFCDTVTLICNTVESELFIKQGVGESYE